MLIRCWSQRINIEPIKKSNFNCAYESAWCFVWLTLWSETSCFNKWWPAKNNISISWCFVLCENAQLCGPTRLNFPGRGVVWRGVSVTQGRSQSNGSGVVIKWWNKLATELELVDRDSEYRRPETNHAAYLSWGGVKDPQRKKSWWGPGRDTPPQHFFENQTWNFSI